MKRIIISRGRVAGRVASLLALFASLALAGCYADPTSTDGTDESGIVSGRPRNVGADEERNAAFARGPSQTLELKALSDTQGQGPHPEPWLDREGPHPEPWQSKDVASTPEPDPNGNGDNKKP